MYYGFSFLCKLIAMKGEKASGMVAAQANAAKCTKLDELPRPRRIVVVERGIAAVSAPWARTTSFFLSFSFCMLFVLVRIVSE